MAFDAFHVGQYVEFLEGPFKGEEALVWRIGDEYLELLREDDFEPVKTPCYVALQDANSKIRLLQPKQEPTEPRPLACLPPGAECVYETCDYHPKGMFDEHHIVAWRGPLGPLLDVVCSRHFGVFPKDRNLEPEDGMDGTWPYYRRLTTEEWDCLQRSFGEFDFWSLPYDDAVRSDERGEYWQLLAYDRGRQHEAWRSYVPNDLEPFCRLLFSIAQQPGLIRGDSSMLS